MRKNIYYLPLNSREKIIKLNRRYRSIVSSELSEEDMEYLLWASTVELPGFDDNVSPHNSIKLLLRFVVGEVNVSPI